MNYLFRSGALLGVFGAMSLVGCGQTYPEKPKHIGVTLASKADNTPFYERLATDSARVIVSESERSTSGIDVTVPVGQALYYVEFRKVGSAQISNEVFRDGRLVLFTAKDLREAVDIVRKVEEFAHPLQIDLSTVKQPSSTMSGVSKATTRSGLIGGISIDAAKMREDLESLSGARPIVINGASHTLANRSSEDNKAKARSWLRATYQALGYAVSEHQYKSGINLVAERKSSAPSDDEIFVVSGHLDTVQTAGADDDGSGVISSLTIARALADAELKRTIRFVAFDEEERGLVGSAAYAKELEKTGEISKVSVFNIEMTGYDSDNDGAFHTIDCNENTSAALSEAMMNAISAEGIALKKVDACTTRSDHAVFWRHDRPAVVVSQNFFGGDGNPCYHRSCDTVQKINWDYMAKITKAAANAIANLNQ